MPRVAYAATCLIFLGITYAPSVQAETGSPSQGSMVAAICSQVMGLRPGESYFAACRESLSQSLATETEDQALAGAAETCRQQGLVSGTAEFSTCMLDKESVGTGTAISPQAGTHLASAYLGDGSLETDKNFYEIAPIARWKRERYACAQLGLIPGSADFGQCITNLDGAFLPGLN